MSQPASKIVRPVKSEDPSLSAEANRLLTEELQATIGSPTVELPGDWPEHSHDRHATHSSLVAALIEVRFYVVMILPVIVLAGMIAFVKDWNGVIPLAIAVMLLALLGVITLIVRMTREVEHLNPDTAAVLSREGVGDPDRLFGDLLAEYRGPTTAARPHGLMSAD